MAAGWRLCEVRSGLVRAIVGLGVGLVVLAMGGASDPTTIQGVDHWEGRLADGAAFVVDKPAAWNGTLLLWSHGFAPRLGPPDDAPPGIRDWTLAQGYALAGTAYSQAGWALEVAVPDQLAVVSRFKAKFGSPRRIIAWGDSMGGLVSEALAERRPQPLAGAIAACGSVAGAVGMMNMALDGAFAFRTLLAPSSDIALVNIDDDRANAAKVAEAVRQAQATGQGRARLALAAALAQEPGWTDASRPRPVAGDVEAEEEQAAGGFAMGVFLPRADQEHRAGGVFSWNTGVDYAAQLNRSGRRKEVEALYLLAGLDLNADLDRLAEAPRIAADSSAVRYMLAHYSPTGALSVPLLTMHTIGDGLTTPAQEDALAQTVRAAGAGGALGQAFVSGAGHCAFLPAERIAALHALEARLDTGRWRLGPSTLNSQTPAGMESTRFVSYAAPVFLRSCSPGPAGCPGAPNLKSRRQPNASEPVS